MIGTRSYQSRWKMIFILLPVILSLLWGSTHAAPVRAAPAASIFQSGWFTIVRGDPSGNGQAQELYMLTDDTGQSSILRIDDAVAESAGGILSFDHKHVSITADSRQIPVARGSPSVLIVNSISLDPLERSATSGADLWPAVTGSQPWISILCKFGDVPVEPHDLAFFQGMYSGTLPGLDHYWREQSYDLVNVAGSGAVGWFTLPKPRSSYIYDMDANGEVEADLWLLAADCTGVADSSVDFSQYVGINMMFNEWLDCCAWGGGYYAALDGVSKVWSTTWEPPWAYADISVIQHEMGHGFGLPHSSGNYGQTYDNAWDVMSSDRFNCAASTDPTYGCIGQHTIAYHKDLLGWIPAPQKFAVAGGSATVTLEQLAQPATGDYRMVRVPIAGSSTHFYTVEVRRQVGYDVKVAGPAVIIHQVDTTRDRPARVIDIDGNGDTGDAGAMWEVGETFTDVAHGISMYVDATTATGFVVTITNAGGLTIPSLIAPPDGSHVLSRCVGFDWTDVTGASGYHIQVSRSSTFRTTLANATSKKSEYTTCALPTGLTLWWRVQARVGGTYRAWSGQWSLEMPIPPSRPVPKAPISGALIKDYTPLLDWFDSTLPANTVHAFDHYELELATNASFATDVMDFTTPVGDRFASSYTIPDSSGLAPNRTYYWHVRAYNAGAEYSAWSATRSFRTAILPPALGLPANGSAVDSRRPVFDWGDVEGASRYKIQISRTSTFGTMVIPATVVSSTFTPGAALPSGVTLYWRVQAVGKNGPSLWSEAWSFTTP